MAAKVAHAHSVCLHLRQDGRHRIPRMRTALNIQISVKMAVIELFTSGAEYKYKSELCSLSFLAVLSVAVLAILTPVFVVRNAGGFSLLHRVYSEQPEVSFTYKYLLIASQNSTSRTPLICSSFASYKDNPISDDCVLVKVREEDTNNDGLKDKLLFEARFYIDSPLNEVKLLLFFRFRFKHLFETSIESIAELSEEASSGSWTSVEINSHLTLLQNAPLTASTLFEASEESLDLGSESLEQLLISNLERKFVAKLSGSTVHWSSIREENEAKVKVELIYSQRSLIFWQPSFLEELKWAWVQYFAFLCAFSWLATRVLAFLFKNRYLSCVIVAPWRNKRAT